MLSFVETAIGLNVFFSICPKVVRRIPKSLRLYTRDLSDMGFHDFMITRDGKVKYVGNPLNSEQLMLVFTNTLNQ